MSKTKNWTIPSIKNEVNKLIKNGLDYDFIKFSLRKNIPVANIEDDMLEMVVDDVIKKHPNFKLMQDILSSELAVDKSEKSGKLYCFQRDKLKSFTINRDHIATLFTKFDYSSRVRMCDFVYCPDKMDKFFLNDGHWVYNTFEPPFWLKDHFFYDSDICDEKLPEMYEKYFKHFTNNHSESYEYVLDWLANSLKNRNYCILTAIAKQGVGKGVLGEIMRVMFNTNYAYIQGEKFNKEFNKELENKKMIFIDELKVKTQDQEDRIKVLINDYINIEGKGEDSKTIKNHASIYMASNNIDAIPLTADDRRFSIIEMSSTKLLEIFNEREIKELMNEENVFKLCKYLWNRKVNHDKMLKVLITERTEEVRRARLNSWQEYFIDELCETYKGEQVLISQISDEIMDIYGSRVRPSQKAFKALEATYPDKFQVLRTRKNNKRVWVLDFKVK